MKRPFQRIGPVTKQAIKIAFEYHIFKTAAHKCWLWTGPVFKKRGGYGAFTMRLAGIIQVRAHRFAWTIYRGNIPKGMHVLHHCDNPRCVNPSHLFIGDQAANMRDKALKGRQRPGTEHPSFKHGRYIGDKQNPEYHRSAN